MIGAFRYSLVYYNAFLLNLEICTVRSSLNILQNNKLKTRQLPSSFIFSVAILAAHKLPRLNVSPRNKQTLPIHAPQKHVSITLLSSIFVQAPAAQRWVFGHCIEHVWRQTESAFASWMPSLFMLVARSGRRATIVRLITKLRRPDSRQI